MKHASPVRALAARPGVIPATSEPVDKYEPLSVVLL